MVEATVKLPNAHCHFARFPPPSLTHATAKISLVLSAGGRSSAWLEPQIVDLAVAGSNPVDHPIFLLKKWNFVDCMTDA